MNILNSNYFYITFKVLKAPSLVSANRMLKRRKQNIMLRVLKQQNMLWKHIFSEMSKYVGVKMITSHIVRVGKVT